MIVVGLSLIYFPCTRHPIALSQWIIYLLKKQTLMRWGCHCIQTKLAHEENSEVTKFNEVKIKTRNNIQDECWDLLTLALLPMSPIWQFQLCNPQENMINPIERKRWKYAQRLGKFQFIWKNDFLQHLRLQEISTAPPQKKKEKKKKAYMNIL